MTFCASKLYTNFMAILNLEKDSLTDSVRIETHFLGIFLSKHSKKCIIDTIIEHFLG